MSNVMDEIVQELFAALTTRWRREDGRLAIGVTREKLLSVGDINQEILDNLLEKLKQHIQPLGMELVEYISQGEYWYAIRSVYACPAELKREEESTLAVCVALLEKKSGKGRKKEEQKAEVSALKRRLVKGQYFTEYQVDKHIKSLEYLGYIQRHQKYFSYGPRSLLELSPESRRHISEQTDRMII